MSPVSEFKPYAPAFEDGTYLTALQKRKICKLLKQSDHKYLYVKAANHVGASNYEFEHEMELDSVFKMAVKDIDKLWGEYMRKQSYDESYEAEGTAAERVRHLEAEMPEKFSQKFKVEHEVSEPNPKLVDAIRDILTKKKLKAKLA